MKSKTNFEYNSVPCWDGVPIDCRVVEITMADEKQFKWYWGRPYVGQQRQALEITTPRGSKFYIDNQDGGGIFKVINGGGMRLGHRGLIPEPGTDIIELAPEYVIYPDYDLSIKIQAQIEEDGNLLWGHLPEYADMLVRAAALRKQIQEGTFMKGLKRT
jgi:hypothetical protein